MLADPADLERAVEVLRLGGVVAFPTDTLYGLAVDPRSPPAVARLFAVKERDAGRAVPLIAADEEQAGSVAEFTPVGRRLARALWPGPLSLVLPAKLVLAEGVAAEDGSIAVRVPASTMARKLAGTFGFCLTATSANLSGHPPSREAAAVARAVGDRIDFLLDAGDAPGGPPSTIVDARGEAPRLLRLGAVPWDRVLESLE